MSDSADPQERGGATGSDVEVEFNEWWADYPTIGGWKAALAAWTECTRRFRAQVAAAQAAAEGARKTTLWVTDAWVPKEREDELVAQLAERDARIEALDGVVEAAEEYRRLAVAQEIHEDGCNDSPCETCTIAAAATVDAERAMFAALDQAPRAVCNCGADGTPADIADHIQRMKQLPHNQNSDYHGLKPPQS